MGWSNDQLNSIYIYDPLTQDLILSIDSNGFIYRVGDKYYEITTEGIKGRLEPDTGSYIALLPVDVLDGVRLVLQAPPRDGVTPWAQTGRVFADIDDLGGGEAIPWTAVSSPGDSITEVSQIQLYGSASDGSFDPEIYFFAPYMTGSYLQQMSLGLCDTYLGTSSTNVAAETIVDGLDGSWFGNGMVADRVYRGDFAGTVSSTVAGNRIRLRTYRCPNFNSLVGATMIAECGEVTISTANIPQPINISSELIGVVADQYIVLTGQRTAGAGTCNVTTTLRTLKDISPIP